MQKSEEINISTESKPQTKSQGVQTSEKLPESKKQQNNCYMSFNDLFINVEKDNENEKDKEKEESKAESNAKISEKKTAKNQEDIKMIHQLFNIPISDQDSFKNKDFKFRFQSNKNINFVNECTVKYIGKGISKIDYGIVQTEKEILNKRPIFYFEANIINDGEESDLLIGIGEKDITEKSIQLGLTTHSYGYHSKGKSYNNKKSNKYAETFKKGDIIGCGVDFINQSIFYTKNGKFLDFAFKEINFELNKGYFYPSICMHSLNTEVKLNFGNENFKFDINNYYENILINKYNILQGFNPKYDDMDYLVKEYLFHEGYMNTFKSMIKNDKKNKTKNKKKEDDDKMDEDDNDDLYLNIDDNLKIEEEAKNKIITDNAMDIEDENNDDENEEYLIENIIELLPKENVNEENKEKDKEKEKDKDKNKEKTDSNKKDKQKDDKKEDKKDDKKEEKKEEKKDEKKEEKKDEKKDDKKEDKKDEKKDDKKDDKKNESDKNEIKMEIEEKKEDKEKLEKERLEKEKLEKEKLEKEKLEKEKIEKAKKEKEQKELEKKKIEMQKFITLRKNIYTFLSNKEFDKAILLLKEKYSNIKEKEEIYKKLYFNIIIMKYLTLLSNENNYIKCFELIDSLDKEYWDKFKILLYENNSYNKTSLVSLQSLATLISQPDITNSDYSFYLSDNQIDLIKHQINSLLFELINLSPLSNLNKISAQLEYMNELYYKVFNCNQELSMKLE